MDTEKYKKLIRELNRIDSRLKVLENNINELKNKQRNGIIIDNKIYQSDETNRISGTINSIKDNIENKIIYSIKNRM